MVQRLRACLLLQVSFQFPQLPVTLVLAGSDLFWPPWTLHAYVAINSQVHTSRLKKYKCLKHNNRMKNDRGRHSLMAFEFMHIHMLRQTCIQIYEYVHKETHKIIIICYKCFTGQCPNINILGAKQYPLNNAFG